MIRRITVKFGKKKIMMLKLLQTLLLPFVMYRVSVRTQSNVKLYKTFLCS